MKLWAVSYGPAWEGNEIDSIWTDKETAEARQRFLKEEYPPEHYCHYLEEYDINKPQGKVTP
jgi:hypothetical protein